MWEFISGHLTDLIIGGVAIGVFVIVPVLSRRYKHIETMRLRDLQTLALQHGYDPLLLDPKYSVEKVKEDEDSEEEEGSQVEPEGQPHDEIYIQGYQQQK